MNFDFTTDSFVAVTFFGYGIFVAQWCARELARGLRSRQMQRFDGRPFSRAEAPRDYWAEIAREAVMSAWGAGWCVVGIIEFLRPHTFC